MKKYYISGLFVAAVVALFALPGVSHAAEKKTKKEAEAAAIAKCEERLVVVNGFKDEINAFKERHYGTSYRAINDPAIVEVKKATVSDGTKADIKTGRVKAKVYKKGGKEQKEIWVKNYEVILQRHEGAIGVLSPKLGLDKTADYQAAITKFGVAISDARGQIDTIAKNWNPNNPICIGSAERNKVKTLSETRAKHLKKIKHTRDTLVNKKSIETSQAYQKVVKDAANKKVLLKKKPATTSLSPEGGAPAPN